MNIGIPKERRPFEYRVGLSPAGVQMLSEQGHLCFVEHEAGLGAGFSDQDYEHAGATIVYSAHEAFGRADFVLKVTRPQDEDPTRCALSDLIRSRDTHAPGLPQPLPDRRRKPLV